MEPTTKTHNVDTLQDIANILRLHVVEMTTKAGSGCANSCASLADILSVLFFDPSGMHYDPANPKSFSADKFYLSKGHAAPLLYAAWAHLGLIDKAELCNFGKPGSNLTAFPNSSLPFVDASSGTHGQGFSVTLGMAYASKHLDNVNNKYFCVMGDAELSEGQVWEACNFGAHYKLDNVVAFVDVNDFDVEDSRLGGRDIETYRKKFEAFRCNVKCIDGHDIKQIIEALDWAREVKDAPAVILAKTVRGKNLSAGTLGSETEGKPLSSELHDAAVSHLKSLIKDQNAKLTPQKPASEVQKAEFKPYKLPPLNYVKGKDVAIRTAYGNALKSLGDQDTQGLLMALDGDTSTSTMACYLAKAHPKKYVECYIAEQNMVSIAQGLSCRGKIPFASAFGAFMSRAYDQIRLIGISQSNVKLCGSHAGVSIGPDGPTQMGLEDLAIFRSLPGCVVFYPSDAVSAERAVELAVNYQGPCYIRTSRPNTAVIYDNEETFEIGKAKVVKQSSSDVLTIVTGGATLIETINAAAKLAEEGINVRIVDIFTVKPVDNETLQKCAKETGGKVLTIEDHYAEGGIHETVSTALSKCEAKVHHIAIETTPQSGTPADLFDKYNLSAKKIHAHVKTLLA
eukprot:CAMPEP_0176444270 /NCGR_PEP_ID=MMETSP0127-20121128/22959_1 /TAXON_ID=938130 /ORGANISM="Platyophrya macrostoma, Strain WH" /LENGTH=624 /DNA_ID=CAMNT_0017829739 /DNA_START=31 /DNA_END=1905 /DNA_ORIENTATION=-